MGCVCERPGDGDRTLGDMGFSGEVFLASTCSSCGRPEPSLSLTFRAGYCLCARPLRGLLELGLRHAAADLWICAFR